jgi:16S rRNA (guanine527-N7)-methyltransferase
MIDLKEQAKTLFKLDLSDEMLRAFDLYTAQLIEWNQRFNLTSITDPEEIQIKHFLDSLSLLTLPNLPEKAQVIDVGTGAGLPGIVLKIVHPRWRVTLIDATAKKIKFLNHVIKTLGFDHTTAQQIRAEDAGQNKRYREQYDLVVARAVARLPTLVEYLLPLCRMGGLCVAMKGDTAQTEMEDAAFALKILGGQLEPLPTISLPTLDQFRYLIPIRKVAPTPSQYPRRAGIPSQKPLLAP